MGLILRWLPFTMAKDVLFFMPELIKTKCQQRRIMGTMRLGVYISTLVTYPQPMLHSHHTFYTQQEYLFFKSETPIQKDLIARLDIHLYLLYIIVTTGICLTLVYDTSNTGFSLREL
jgi:hypothetical protein